MNIHIQDEEEYVDGTDDHLNLDIGDIICLEGKSQEGISDISVHGNFWIIDDLSYYNGKPAIAISTENKTQRMGKQRVRKNRVIYVTDDTNFAIMPMLDRDIRSI